MGLKVSRCLMRFSWSRARTENGAASRERLPSARGPISYRPWAHPITSPLKEALTDVRRIQRDAIKIRPTGDVLRIPCMPAGDSSRRRSSVPCDAGPGCEQDVDTFVELLIFVNGFWPS